MYKVAFIDVIQGGGVKKERIKETPKKEMWLVSYCPIDFTTCDFVKHKPKDNI